MAVRMAKPSMAISSSGIMRIDVDKNPGNPEPHPHAAVPTDMGVARYSIPVDNPYVTNDPTISYNGQDLPSNYRSYGILGQRFSKSLAFFHR